MCARAGNQNSVRSMIWATPGVYTIQYGRGAPERTISHPSTKNASEIGTL